MKRKFLKLLGCIVFVFVSFNLIITNRSEAVVSQTADFYVNDSAKVLDASLENYTISTNKSLYSQTGAQIVVVTINSLKGEDNDTSFSSIAFSFMLITIMIIIPLCNKKARRVIAVLAGISSVGSLILAMMVGGIWLTICILSVFVLIVSISSGHGGGFYGGGSSFGGGSSGGGSFRRWRFLRWRRLFKKFLKSKNRLKKQLKTKKCNGRMNVVYLYL